MLRRQPLLVLFCYFCYLLLLLLLLLLLFSILVYMVVVQILKILLRLNLKGKCRKSCRVRQEKDPEALQEAFRATRWYESGNF